MNAPTPSLQPPISQTLQDELIQEECAHRKKYMAQQFRYEEELLALNFAQRRAAMEVQPQMPDSPPPPAPTDEQIKSQQELQDLLAKQRISIFGLMGNFTKSLGETVRQIQNGYRVTMWMYGIAFALGVGLVAIAVWMAFAQSDKAYSTLFGSMGMVDLVGFLIFKPADKLQASRGALTQLQAAFFNWFSDTLNLNGYLQIRSTNNQLPLISFQEVKEVSDTLMEHTNQMIFSIHEYCDATGSPIRTLPKDKARKTDPSKTAPNGKTAKASA